MRYDPELYQAIVLPHEETGEVPDRVCPVCGVTGPPKKIIRVVYYDTKPSV